MAHIYISHFVVMPSVTKVSDVAWFLRGWRPVIIIVPYVGSRGPNFCFIFIIVFIPLGVSAKPHLTGRGPFDSLIFY